MFYNCTASIICSDEIKAGSPEEAADIFKEYCNFTGEIEGCILVEDPNSGEEWEF